MGHDERQREGDAVISVPFFSMRLRVGAFLHLQCI